MINPITLANLIPLCSECRVGMMKREESTSKGWKEKGISKFEFFCGGCFKMVSLTISIPHPPVIDAKEK